MNDEQVHSEAKRLGIDISNMEWNERHSVVSKALAAETKDRDLLAELEKAKRELAVEKARNKEMRVRHENYDDGRDPTRDEMLNIPIEVAPYIPDKGRPGHPKGIVEEELNYDVTYNNNDFVRDGMPQNLREGESQFGTFQHRGYMQQKVIGTRGDPCYNAGIKWNPNEMFMTVYTGDVNKPEKEGYLWAQIKALLKTINGGAYLNKYRTELYGQPNAGIEGMISHIKGRYILPKEYANDLIQRIQKEERKRIMEEQKYQKGLDDGELFR